MEKEDDILENGSGDEEDLLNLDLDDISSDNVGLDSSELEDEIIELVDIIEKGEGVEDRVDEDVTELQEEDSSASEEISSNRPAFQ